MTAPRKPAGPIKGLPDDPLARDAEIQARLAAAHLEIAGVAARLADAQGAGNRAAAIQLVRDWQNAADLVAQLGSVAGGVDVDSALARVTALGRRSAVDDPAQLDGSLPVALLPVRIETRFATGAAGPELLVRIYPDDIHADRHEPELTDLENAAGRAYWTETAGVSAGSQAAIDAWRALSQQYGPRRAAWIAHELTPKIIPGKPPLPPTLGFPGVTIRGGPWTRPALSAILPDRWLVLGYAGGVRVMTASSSIVPDPLQVGPSPTGNAPAVVDGKASLDPGAAWLSGFDAALAAGMALRIPITAAQASDGFDRLVVLGVKSTVSATEGATLLQAALDAHHYTGGLSFADPGTPTNATEQDRPPADALAEGVDTPSWAVERGNPLAADTGGDGARTAAWVGVPVTTFDHVAGADRTADAEAAWMNTLLWPATFGYFFWQIVQPLLTDDQREALRDHFRDHVRARGPLPCLRIGNQPYGLLAVSSLDRWQPLGEDVTAAGVAEVARRLRSTWWASLANLDTTRSADPDGSLLRMLGMTPNAATAIARTSVTREYAVDTAWFFGLDTGRLDWDALAATVGAQLATALGHPAPLVQLAELGSDPGTGAELDGPWVIDPHRPQVTAPVQYLQRLADDPPEQLWGVHSLVDGDPVPLLAALGRHSVLREYSEAAARKLRLAAPDRLDRVLVGIPVPTEQARDWLNRPAKVKGGPPTTLGGLLNAGGRGGDGRLEELRAAVRGLAGLDPDRLDLLLRETLGLSGWRLDAWITSLASKRLADLRAAGKVGIHVGGYGWVEDLRPDTSLSTVPPPHDEPSDLVVWSSEANKGFVHAPSLNHATTAALLRSGYLSHDADGHGAAVAVSLTSERVREAAWLLDAVRQGQSLGALLGYRLERALHERHGGLDLDKCIAPLRALEPIMAGKLTPQRGNPAKSVVAANVADGLRLLRRWQSGVDGIPFGSQGLPTTGSDEANAIDEELGRLSDLVDGLSDTILAESVHHIALGRPDAAVATLDALSRGDTPPPAELEVARTPRSGVGVSHRVAVLLRGDITPVAWGAGATPSPRAVLEPMLEAWAAQLLPDPAKIGCEVESFAASGKPLKRITVHLSDLGMSALDFVYAAVPGEAAEASEIELRVAFHALTDIGAALADRGGVRVQVRYDHHGSGEHGFPAALWQASELRALLHSARALVPDDLELPGSAAVAVDSAELSKRLQDLVTAMTGAADRLDDRAAVLLAGVPAADDLGDTPVVGPVTDLEAALLAATPFNTGGSVPVGGFASERLSEKALLAAAQGVVSVLRERCAALTQALGAGGRWEAIADAGHAALGAGIRLMPRFDPADRAGLDAAITGSAGLLGGDAFAADDFLTDAAAVRKPLARLTSALGSGRAMRAVAAELTAPDFAAVQFPLDPTDRWIGLPNATDPPRAGRLSLLLNTPDLGGTGDTVAGLWVDEWVEVIPDSTAVTGLTFHQDAPAAAAPQAILLAAPPDAQADWSLDALEAILLETLDLAKLRLVDIDALTDGGALAPAAWLAMNTAGDTVSTDFEVVRTAP
jgi:hypothetical protein